MAKIKSLNNLNSEQDNLKTTKIKNKQYFYSLVLIYHNKDMQALSVSTFRKSYNLNKVHIDIKHKHLQHSDR